MSNLKFLLYEVVGFSGNSITSCFALTHSHTCTHTYKKNTQVCTETHTQKHVQEHSHTCTHTQTCTETQMHTNMYRNTHAHKHVQKNHTRTHTCTETHTCFTHNANCGNYSLATLHLPPQNSPARATWRSPLRKGIKKFTQILQKDSFRLSLPWFVFYLIMFERQC